LHKIGKVEQENCHSSGKVPCHKDAKSNVGGGGGQKSDRKLPTCRICKQIGHTQWHYQLPPTSKGLSTELVDYDNLSWVNECQIRQPKQTEKALDLVATEDWL
jgi:hypothetical protein